MPRSGLWSPELETVAARCGAFGCSSPQNPSAVVSATGHRLESTVISEPSCHGLLATIARVAGVIHGPPLTPKTPRLPLGPAEWLPHHADGSPLLPARSSL